MFQLPSPRKTCEKTFVSLFTKETYKKILISNDKQQQSEFRKAEKAEDQALRCSRNRGKGSSCVF